MIFVIILLNLLLMTGLSAGTVWDRIPLRDITKTVCQQRADLRTLIDTGDLDDQVKGYRILACWRLHEVMRHVWYKKSS
jgi:hypothetical protein